MPDSKNNMQAAAVGAVKYILKPDPADKALILADPYSRNIVRAFTDALGEYNIPVDIFLLEDKIRPLKEIPPRLEELLPGKTIVLNIIKAFPEEIQFRIKWIFKVEENKKIKMLHMPGITEEMMLSSVNVDFEGMKIIAELLLNNLRGADELHITMDIGTDLRLGVKERHFVSDIGVAEGDMCNIPCGEIYCAPLETKGNGIIIFDASIGDIGILKHPLKVFLKDGRIQKFESEDKVLLKRITELTDIDDDAWIIGELGIGINPNASVTGNMLEDEKALGTAHIAFGNNEDFPGGGNNHSSVHRDFLFYKPSIRAYFADNSEKLIMENGVIIG